MEGAMGQGPKETCRNSSQQQVRKQGAQSSRNCILPNDLNELGSRVFLRVSKRELSLADMLLSAL